MIVKIGVRSYDRIFAPYPGPPCACGNWAVFAYHDLTERGLADKNPRWELVCSDCHSAFLALLVMAQ